MKDQMRVLNRQLQDALQQRDEQRSKTTSTIESKRRLEEQVPTDRLKIIAAFSSSFFQVGAAVVG